LALELLAVAALILLNAFFVAAEYGLVTARRTRLRELDEEGNKRARRVIDLISQPPRFVAAMQLGVTLTSLGIGALGEPVLSRVFDNAGIATAVSLTLAFLIVTFLHVVLGELVPKGMALSYSDRVALGVSAPVQAFFFLFKPVIWVLQTVSELTLRALGMRPPAAESPPLSEGELRMLLETSSEHGQIEKEETEMLYKVFDFADKEASDVMVPRPEVVALSVNLPPSECLTAVIDSPFTRYPVYRGTLENIVGILHVRDLFSAINEGGIESVHVEALLREPQLVPETKDLAALLADFRRSGQHMAVVVDEYGGMEGIVTLEDLLEEIVGEIEDEFDLPDESVERIADDTVHVDGTFAIDDFNEQFGVELPLEDYHTLAGFVFGELGHAPERGDVIEHDGIHFEVLEVEGSRIDRLAVKFEPAQAGD
jgi:CBS domain containing-hemolysin-like protein